MRKTYLHSLNVNSGISIPKRDEIIVKYQESQERSSRIFHPRLNIKVPDAIENPFSLNSLSLNNYIKNSNLSDLICKLTGWSDCGCVLARVFLMPRCHMGDWHIDAIPELEEHGDVYQVTISFAGLYFNIASSEKKSKEIQVKNSNLIFKRNILPLCLSQDFSEHSDILFVEPGSIVGFDPRLIHRGMSFGNRFDLHMRFVPLSHDFCFDESLNLYLSSALYKAAKCDVSSEINRKANVLPDKNTASLKSRLYCDFSYYLPIIQLLVVVFLRAKYGVKLSYFAGTAYQGIVFRFFNKLREIFK